MPRPGFGFLAHIFQNSAIIGYAVELALLISSHLSTEIAPKPHAARAHRKVCEWFGY